MFDYYYFVLQTAARKERTHASLRTKRLVGVNLVKTTKTQQVGATTKKTTTTTKTTVSKSS